MKQSLFAAVITYYFILLFLYTGAVKLSEVHLFKEQLISSPLVGSLAGVITWALPISEILLAIALCIPAWRLKSLYATLTLMTLFTVYVTIIYFMDNHLSCSCGGIIEELSPKQHILFNSASVILSLVAILNTRKQKSTRRFKWLTATSTLSLFLLVGFILFTAFSTPATEKTGMEGRLLPSFDILLADSITRLNTANIPSGQPFIIFGFSPWCTHCQSMTRDIIKNIQQFKNTRIYYVTPYPFDEMKTFYRFYKLAKYPDIVMGKDLKNYYFPYFKTNHLPYIAIYDSKRRLKRIISAEVKAITLAQATAEE